MADRSSNDDGGLIFLQKDTGSKSDNFSRVYPLIIGETWFLFFLHIFGTYLLASKNDLAKPCGVIDRLVCRSIFPNASGWMSLLASMSNFIPSVCK